MILLLLVVVLLMKVVMFLLSVVVSESSLFWFEWEFSQLHSKLFLLFLFLH